MGPARITRGMVNVSATALFLMAMGCCCSEASAQVTGSTSDLADHALPVVVGERLSDWLLRNQALEGQAAEPHWRVKAERAPQEHLRRAALGQLAAHPMPTASPPAADHSGLERFLISLPITGRLTLASSDPRWLQAAPSQDPVLQDGHTVLRFTRPKGVTLVRADGSLCLVRHSPGGLIADYLLSCKTQADGDSAQKDSVDWAWLVQPDGRVQRVGIAPWNLSEQDEPAPGAWLWAPARGEGISLETSDNIARFLATQLPAEALAIQTQRTVLKMVDFVPSDAEPEMLTPLRMSASDWGEIGLLQTPTARMESAGNGRMQLSTVDPYGRINVMLQPVDWLEAGFRYTRIANRLYGPEIAGDQSFVDKSLDLKLRLRKEDASGPQVALGLRDIGGTGLFSGEYVVASRRWANWDTSLGLGWGYMGGRGNVSAPLAFLGESFKTRAAPDVGQGGTPSFTSMFHGNAALIGGVQWHAPGSRWLLKAELDGNDYSKEPLDNYQTVNSPFNFGASYRYSPNVDFSVGVERGTKLMLGLTLHADFGAIESPKLLDPPVPAVQGSMPIVDVSAPYWRQTATSIERLTGWRVQELGQSNEYAVLTAESDSAHFLQERVDKAAVILHRDAPASVRYFALHLREFGIALSEIVIDRAEWVARRTQPVPPSMRLPLQTVYPGGITRPASATLPTDAAAYRLAGDSRTSVEWGPSYSQILGGPSGFVVYQAGIQATMEHRFTQNTRFSAVANARLLDNYSNFTYDAPSELPRVRTYAREFTTTSSLTLPVAQVTHVKDLGDGNYASVYGGMLESMYGGVGAEWLHRGWQSPVAFGVDVNHVRQRDFRQDLGLRDYEVNTGHASVYWDTGWSNVQVKLMAGQYLAGDTGVTLDISRVFANGVSMGLWATKTNVSAQQFGEGSFDKGMYVNIPFDAMLPISSPGKANIVWNPLTRDGGARLDRQVALFDITSQRGAKAWSWQSKPLSSANDRHVSANDTSYVMSEPGSVFGNPLDLAGGVTRQIGDIPASTWMWAGALVLASTALDSNVDSWAQNHQGEKWQRVASVANGVPYALAAGAGLSLAGLAGDDMAHTAMTSLVAGSYTLGANVFTKYLVGRARPADELGPNSFNGGTSTALQSSFASNHVALAFAIATPFARQYDQPWLYGLAAFTGFGRIQSRDHWASDTVAGGLLGYAIGAISSDQQTGNNNRMRLSATPQSVSATWAF